MTQQKRRTHRAGKKIARGESDRTFDRTSLRSNSHGLWIHRDYAAHFFRWGFAKRFINTRTKVLDSGCGVEAPLINVLTPALSHVPAAYVGIDMNKLPGKRTPSRQWATFYGETDATDAKVMARIAKKHGPFDVIISLEQIEHMSKAAGLRLLKALRGCLAPGGIFLLSTPVFDGKAARNHIHEYTIDELKKWVEKAGWVVRDRFGTFMRQRDLKVVATPAEWSIFLELKQYYDDDVIACFLAPLHPDQARNNIWILSDSATPEKEKPKSARPAPAQPAVPTRRRGGAPGKRLTAQDFTAQRIRHHFGDRLKLTKEEREKILEERKKKFPDRSPKLTDISFVLHKMRKGLL